MAQSAKPSGLRYHRHVAKLPILIVAIALGALTSIADAQLIERAPPTFTVRADATRANPLNAIISEIGEPAETLLPNGATPKLVLAELCGERAPKDFQIVVRSALAGAQSYIRYAPCLRERALVRVKVREGDNLELIATRLGLRTSEVGRLRVVTSKGDVTLGRLTPGQIVIAHQVPEWTTFTTKPNTVRNRSEFVDRVSVAFECRAEDKERCLTRRNVIIYEEPPKPSLERTLRRTGAIRSEFDHRTDLVKNTAQTLVSAQQDNTVPGSQSRVAKDQWPFDQELIVAIMKQPDPEDWVPVRVGIAEGGLANRDGGPLPASSFALNGGEMGPDTHPGIDDDDNDYVDDVIGAGVPRPGHENDRAIAGDVSLCDPPVTNYANWSALKLEDVSHGSLVSSLAAAHYVRKQDPAIDVRLPRIVFYRMSPSACAEDSVIPMSNAGASRAVEYLVRRNSSVINLSFVSEAGATLSAYLFQYVVNVSSPFFVLAAGNDGTGNLDASDQCPQCLGKTHPHKVLVVGAANSDLQRASYSGFGDKTVALYAPGDAGRALTIVGAQPTDKVAGTSFSAPVAALGYGILSAMIPSDPSFVRARLFLSSWPLLDAVGNPVSPFGAGIFGARVLDLTKVVAARSHALEVLHIEDGQSVRRTYVGVIAPGSNLCPGTAVTESKFQAVQFGEIDEIGSRKGIGYKRNLSLDGLEFQTTPLTCPTGGSVTINDYRSGPKTFSMNVVTQVLFKAKI
jgi:hypothetical protein